MNRAVISTRNRQAFFRLGPDIVGMILGDTAAGATREIVRCVNTTRYEHLPPVGRALARIGAIHIDLGTRGLVVDMEPKVHPAIGWKTPPHLATGALVAEHALEPDEIERVTVRSMQMSAVVDFAPGVLQSQNVFI